MAMTAFFRRIKAWYTHFTDTQGFPVLIVVCVGIIAGTALWTDRDQAERPSETTPVSEGALAAQLQQQLLQDAVTPSPASSAKARSWCMPVEDGRILRGFSVDAMVQGDVTGIWRVHDGIDISAALGAPIMSMADGTVLECGEDPLQGVWLLIDHGDGIRALYAGMQVNADYAADDSVRAGDVIGLCGSGLLDESGMAAHVHLRVTKDGVAVDPSLLWET